MTARVLVVDDIEANIKLLEARLIAEYFEVLTASSGPEALKICSEAACDIILLDVMMPGMDGFEVCRRLKADPKTAHIPVIMVSALDQSDDRVKGLEAGADDFLTKPVNDVTLLTRVKSLVRLKMMTDELYMRAMTGEAIGLDAKNFSMDQFDVDPARILVVDERRSSAERIGRVLDAQNIVDLQSDAHDALFQATDGNYDLCIVSLSMRSFDGLRFCSQIRSLERTRTLPLLVMADSDDHPKLLRALELGVNDYLLRPIEQNELRARVRTQVRRKRFTDELRHNVEATMAMAVTDSLTSLHNRRYLESHLSTLFKEAERRGKNLSIMVLDIDHFKSVNDTYGHDAGDVVLREFSQRIRSIVRSIDLPCRLGGEEFVVVMPDTDLDMATGIAERVREEIAMREFTLRELDKQLPVTTSIGVATLQPGDKTPEDLLKRADVAVYDAKRAGRNRVIAEAA
ncbi:PleD family two-component system response regulator [Coralliovum pocilloporae]|uniref:PleD family two-component system response regulator n=1 Tax=Coralliovum pocilloporae TaxID=3066369 RepID=UPI003306CD50